MTTEPADNNNNNSALSPESEKLARVVSPGLPPSRPGSRGINFSRPTTMYSIGSSSGSDSFKPPVAQFHRPMSQYSDGESGGGGVGGAGDYFSPVNSPKRSRQLSTEESATNGVSSRKSSSSFPATLQAGNNVYPKSPTATVASLESQRRLSEYPPRTSSLNYSSENDSNPNSAMAQRRASDNPSTLTTTTTSTTTSSQDRPKSTISNNIASNSSDNNNNNSKEESKEGSNKESKDGRKDGKEGDGKDASKGIEKRRPTKICKQCGEPISGQFVRALGAAYHIDCFVCADCGDKCSAKFFPIEASEEQRAKGITHIPLCEKDYFKRLELLCFVCDGALRGSYITALGRKYHVEHFTCSMCSTVFGPEDSYYEYQDSIYCHFHYSTLFASRCEGCQTSILKQFVEIFRGGREQQWHPECYMIFKFWNVKLSPDSVGPSLNPLRPLSPTASAPLEELTRDAVVKHEREVDDKVFRIWTVLCGFEEVTAAYISDMLQTASSGHFNEALAATTKLVLKIETLFTAIDHVCALIDPIIKKQTQETGESSYSKLGKEAKTLCKKVVGFMSLISKSREKGLHKMGITQELLNLVTSLAHYLKLLIRFGLSNSLQYDRQFLDGTAVDDLLDLVSSHESSSNSANPLSSLGVTAMTSDHCYACDLSIEDRCVRLGERRWHLECLSCSQCHKSLGVDQEVDPPKLLIDQARWSSPHKKVFCASCAPSEVRSGFALVPKLRQFVFLLKIAVARLQLVLNAFDARDKKAAVEAAAATTTSPVTAEGTTSTLKKYDSQSSENSLGERGYMTTLTDIRRLRSTKLDKQVSESSHHARRSHILTIPDSEEGQMAKNDSTNSLAREAAASSYSLTTTRSEEYSAHVDGDGKKKRHYLPRKNKKKELHIEEEPNRQKGASRLDRTTDLFKNEKSLTLDDIPRIVAAEQAREQRPNAFRHKARGTSNSHATPEPKSVTDFKKSPQKKYISELSEVEWFTIRHIAVLLMEDIVSEWFTLDELFDMIDVKRNPSLWEKFGKAFGGSGGGNSAKKDKKKAGVFGVSLTTLTEKYGVDSTLGVGPGPLRIPAFIDDCISAMRQKDMSVEGVFRKNGNIRRLKEFSEKIDKQPDKGGILSEENPVQLAALLKKFLRELPEPLMTSKLQKLWISAQNIQDFETRKRLLHLTCCLLPRTHRDVMEVLFFFLNWTASFSHIDEESGSKMDAHNLATVITPNILYLKQKDGSTNGESGDAYFLSIESVNTLIEEQSQFAEVPEDVMAILQHSNLANATAELTTKEILTRYEQYMKDEGARVVASANQEAQATAANLSVPQTAAMRTTAMADVETVSLSGSRPAPIRIDTELAQKMAQDHEMYPSIKRVQSSSTESPNSPAAPAS
ncbi:hypothetical protein TRVA0_054S00848 [Trichomonascus vanleenenianus]|uniref:uncharacterized protein n=1 Tax=Trichomonascus vanleenenianus TaxID=2268995 RepID=UPI003EC9A0CA